MSERFAGSSDFTPPPPVPKNPTDLVKNSVKKRINLILGYLPKRKYYQTWIRKDYYGFGLRIQKSHGKVKIRAYEPKGVTPKMARMAVEEVFNMSEYTKQLFNNSGTVRIRELRKHEGIEAPQPMTKTTLQPRELPYLLYRKGQEYRRELWAIAIEYKIHEDNTLDAPIAFHHQPQQGEQNYEKLRLTEREVAFAILTFNKYGFPMKAKIDNSTANYFKNYFNKKLDKFMKY